MRDYVFEIYILGTYGIFQSIVIRLNAEVECVHTYAVHTEAAVSNEVVSHHHHL